MTRCDRSLHSRTVTIGSNHADHRGPEPLMTVTVGANSMDRCGVDPLSAPPGTVSAVNPPRTRRRNQGDVIPGFPRVRTQRAHPRPRRARRNAGRIAGIPASPSNRRTPSSRPRYGPLRRSPVPARVQRTANCPSLDTRRVAATPTGPRPDRAAATGGRNPTVPGRPVTLGGAPDHGPGGRGSLPKCRVPRHHEQRRSHPRCLPDPARSSSDEALSSLPGFHRSLPARIPYTDVIDTSH
jgi:hypothetical protein